MNKEKEEPKSILETLKKMSDEELERTAEAWKVNIKKCVKRDDIINELLQSKMYKEGMKQKEE